MKIECTPKEAADKNVFVFPTKDYCEILFFQSKNEMLKSAAAYPDTVIPILGCGSDTELDDMFPNVYCALRKHLYGIGDISGFRKRAEQSVRNSLATQQ